MHEQELDLQAALGHIDERWDERKLTQHVERAQRALHTRRRRRAVLTGGAALLSLVCVTFALTRNAEPAPRAAANTSLPAQQPSAAAVASGSATPEPLSEPGARALASGTEPASSGEALRRIVLSDGSQVVLLDPDSRAIVRQDVHARASVELIRGRARFEVVRRPERVFRVHSAGVNVQVLGTVFELERTALQTHVLVTRGRVAVSWNDGRRDLGVSEAGWFPPAPPVSPTAPRAASAGVRESAQAPSAAAESRKVSGWRDTAERGEYARAYALLQQPGPVPLSVEELLLAADAARLSGHPEAALPYLRRVIDEHAQDSRASLAAFTLGGVLMQQLARPREAEAAYAKARALAVHSSLAQDALARQVEAAQRAGDPTHARALADEYLSRYPDGRRVHAVRRFAGLSVE
jgi:transmembrane sensor